MTTTAEKYTYNYVDPGIAPFKKRIRFTRGKFSGWTEPMGIMHVPYAIFRNRASEVLIPVYDLTPETRQRIGQPPEGERERTLPTACKCGSNQIILAYCYEDLEHYHEGKDTWVCRRCGEPRESQP